MAITDSHMCHLLAVIGYLGVMDRAVLGSWPLCQAKVNAPDGRSQGTSAVIPTMGTKEMAQRRRTAIQ